MPEIDRVLAEIPTMDGEPERVYLAFQDYCNQGVENPSGRRSRNAIAEKYGVSKVAVHKWYHDFNWELRVKQFDALRKRQSALGIKVKVHDDDKSRATAMLVSAETTIGLSVIGELNKRLGEHLSGDDPLEMADMRYLVSTLKIASDMVRRGLELPINVRSNAGNRVVDNGSDENDGVGEVFEIGLT